MRCAAAAVLLVACSPHETPVADCGDDLGGVWSTPGGRWMMLDSGTTLEAYPMFDDSVPAGAPRVIDLTRDPARPSALGGGLARRFMRRAEVCTARASVHVTQCTGDTLQVVLGEVPPPLTFSPCAWGQQMPAHVETWRRD
jgi:hypothetical protein